MTWTAPAPRTLEGKQDEKSRLYRRYRAAKRAEWTEICEREPRLIAFRQELRRLHDPAAVLSRLADSWLRSAPSDVRFAALQQIDRHSAREAQRLGRSSLDDPLPPATSVFFVAKEMLGVR